MKVFSFEKLIVWQKSKALTIIVYEVTRLFPDEEKFGLVSQMRRSAVSIVSNLAEGSGRNHTKDKARFTEIAYGSALELLNQIIISNELDFLSEANYNTMREQLTEITAMLDGLRKSQLKNHS